MVSTAKEAKLNGEKYYLTGMPCTNGHISKRYTSTRICKSCSDSHAAKYRSSLNGKAVSQKHRDNNKRLIAQKQRNASRFDIEKRRKARWNSEYGITPSFVSEMLLEQDNKCSICRTELDNGRRTHIDHCHKANKVRGILCGHCNAGLGHFKDSIDSLRAAITYLEKPYVY